MADLKEGKIVKVNRDSSSLGPERTSLLLRSLPDWRIVPREGIPRLEKSFPFKDFLAALEFANRLGSLAEAADHHPAILVSWGRAAVSWWTHTISGLHENDFIMAARTEELYQRLSDPLKPGS